MLCATGLAGLRLLATPPLRQAALLQRHLGPRLMATRAPVGRPAPSTAAAATSAASDGASSEQHTAAAAAAGLDGSSTQQQEQQPQQQPAASMPASSSPRKEVAAARAPRGGTRRPPREPGQKRWSDRPAYRCPSCGQAVFKVDKLGAHLLRCCPDVAIPEEWAALLAEADPAAASAALSAAAGAAGEQQQQVQQQAQQQQAQQVAEAAGQWWTPHPAHAAIESWMEVVAEREAAIRRKAVSVGTLGAAGWLLAAESSK